MCGAIRFSISPPYTGVISCHCKQCQRLHGNYNPLLIGEKENFKFLEGENNASWYSSSEHSERGFCKTCGSVMFKRDKNGPKMKISVGSLDETSDLKTIKNVSEENAGGYYEIPKIG